MNCIGVLGRTDRHVIADTKSCDLCATIGLSQFSFYDVLMHWSFKTGYHEIAAKKFLSSGAPFPDCKSFKHLHGPGSCEGWILVESDDPKVCYDHAAEWAEIMHWTVTPVCTDEEAAPLIAKVYG